MIEAVPEPVSAVDPVAAVAADFALCKEWIARHSRSFYLSSLLLPKELRPRAWALYAFCRRADDAVDDGGGDPRRRVDALRERLRRVYGGAGAAVELFDPIDRAFARVVQEARIPQAVPGRLLRGMERDANARGPCLHASWEELLVYCFEVAATVGIMMTAIMGRGLPAERRGEVLLRAADLGVAMQLTNIARDVGEDARLGRVYLPADLLGRHGSSPDEVLGCGRRGARPPAGLRRAVEELLRRAAAHYAAADLGIPMLPRPCQLAIRSARLIYAAIGDRVAARGHDSVTSRAVVPLGHQLLLVLRAWGQGLVRALPPAERTAGPADGQILALLHEIEVLP